MRNKNSHWFIIIAVLIILVIAIALSSVSVDSKSERDKEKRDEEEEKLLAELEELERKQEILENQKILNKKFYL